MQNKVFAWVVAVTGGILCIPLVAMQFTSEVDWDVSDFIVMAVLLFCAGFTLYMLQELCQESIEL